VRTVDDYRRAVPIGDFEAHRPYVERMMLGEADVLFAGRPIIYNTTSGTTDKPKMIPISQAHFQQGIANMNRLWLYGVMKDNPHIYDGKSLSAVAPAEDGTVADGTPYGSISGLSFRSIPAVLKSTYSFPYDIVCIRDYERKYYAMMRYALPCNITFIICPSPSNLLRFHQTVMESVEDLLRDIRDGTLRRDVAEQIPEAGRAAALAELKPDPEAAKRLEGLIAAHGAGLRPKHYWPNLACVNVWKQGNFRLMLPKLDGYYAGTTVLREFGYQASEARAGLVLANDWDCSVLATHLYHFEFIPESERASRPPATLLAHELRAGQRYYLLLSNGSGLYRYDINDIVEVTGFHRQAPMFRFLQKGEGITSLTGEKLSEQQVIRAAADAAEAARAPVEFYVMFCDESEMVYKLFVEYGPQATAAVRQAFVDEFDRRLRASNPEYETKRGSKRLAAPRAIELAPGSRERYKSELVRRRLTTDGQYKDLYLTRKPVTREVLDLLAVPRAR